MQLTKIRSDSNGGQSPTLYRTDRGTFVIQGWRVDDVEALAAMDLPTHETAVEVPAGLLSELAQHLG